VPPILSKFSHRICNNRSHGSDVYMLHTDSQGHTNNIAMFKVKIVYNIPVHKAIRYGAYTTVLSVNVTVPLIC